MAIKYNPNAFLSLTLDSDVAHETGRSLIEGMYPMVKMQPMREINYGTKFSPLRGTAFEYMVQGVYYSTGQKVCLATPI